MMLATATVEVEPIGRLRLAASDRGIAALAFADTGDHLDLEPWLAAGWAATEGRNAHLDRLLAELARYGRGACAFTVPHDHRFVPGFFRTVLDACRAIPPGATLGYGELAAQVGRPGGARAVGQAMARNPTPLLVPCHRVLAGGQRLGGFTGGLAMKRRLLAHEGVLIV